MSTRLTIQRLGAQGDGIVHGEKGPLFVPFALPGEVVNAAVSGDRADVTALLEPSPQRVDPPCRHFGTCGGCALQHLEHRAYLDFKKEQIVRALESRRIEAEVGDTVACAPHSRRRVTWTARRTIDGMLLGYRKAMSHEIVPIEEDPIAVPAIESAIGLIRELATHVCATSEPFRLLVTATGSGLDVSVTGGGKLSDTERRAAADFAMRSGLARLSVDGEIVIEPRKPVIMFGDISAEPPPGAFLQAVEAVEEAMAGLVGAHLGRSKKIADLFAGSGAFALRLAKTSQVHAVEGEAPALATLDRAARFASGLKQVTTERRDLFRRPLMVKELARFDGLVFDPPRAGAEDQAKQIARSDIPAVAAVSCNPITLARDLSILVEGGYRVKRVIPLDQFLWSPHVEAVALLEKPKRRR
jgi:23S rRNA (uracil1939-C5)-methyltransferase